MHLKTLFVPGHRLLLCTLFLVIGIGQLSAQEPDAPTIQACEGVQQFCIENDVSEACVSIIVDADYDEPIDFFEIDWGDGTVTMVDGSLDPPNQFHNYNFADSCVYAIDVTIRLDTYLEDGTSINNGFFPTFYNLPTASMTNTPSFTCVGEEVCFGNNSCPTTNLTVLGWTLADGTPLEEGGCYTFTEAGTYTVSLEVENICGIVSTSHTITVLDPATANATVTAGVANPGPGSEFNVCLVNGMATVTLDGASLSENELNYLWEVLGTNSGFEWLIEPPNTLPNEPDQQIIFTQEGTYQVQLETNNQCGQAATDVLTFVVEGGGVSIDPQPDACVTLEYTPSPFLMDAVYEINGEIITNFPITLSPDEYIVKVNSISAFCATIPACDTFLVLEQTVAAISTPDTVLCALDPPLMYVATPETGGTWRIGGVVFDGTLDPGGYPPGDYLITYGNDPCIVTDEVMLTIVGAELTLPSDTELCVDDEPVLFTVVPEGGTFSGIGITPEGLFDPQAVAPGEYTIFYELVNMELPSCSNLDSFVVTVTELSAGFSVMDCDGNALCFTLENTSDNVVASWDFGGTGMGTGSNPCHTFPAAGSYDVTLMVSRGNCEASVTQTITIEESPVAGFDLTYDPDLCSALAVTITNQATGANLQYEWYLNGELFNNTPQPDDLLLQAEDVPTSFTVLQVVSNDCATVMIEETLIVQPAPVSNFGTNVNQYCSGDTIIIANISSGLPSGYEWYFNGELVSTDSIEPVIAYQTTVTDTVQLCLVTSNNCGIDTLCRDLVFVPTDVNALFNLDPATVCANDSVFVTNLSTPNVPVFYDLGDGNSTSQPTFAYQYSTPGEYLIQQQAFGCGFDDFSQLLTVVAAPLVNWINPGVGCPGETLVFTNASPGAMQYLWEFGDDTTSELQNPLHQYAEPGIYEVCLTVFASGIIDCSATLCQEVEIFQAMPAAFAVSDSVCLGQLVEITNLTVEPPVNCFYDWGDGNSSDDCNATHIYSSAGDYVITQIVEGENGCLDTTQQIIHIRPLPEPDFAIEIMDACTPDSVAFSNSSTMATSYTWNFGDGSTSNLTSPTHVYQVPGTYEVILTAFRNGICPTSISQIIQISETPQAIIVTDDNPICASAPNLFTSQSLGPINQFKWNMGDGTVAFSETVSHQYSASGTYSVELIVCSPEGCADTTQINVEVAPEIMVLSEQQAVSCAQGDDGNIALSYISGTAPFSTIWSNGAVSTEISDLSAATYSVTTTDIEGCTWDSTFVITEPLPLAANYSSGIVTCAEGVDGTLMLEEIIGGTAPYQFYWENGSTDSLLVGLAAGNYLLDIIDVLGCSLTISALVTENPPVSYVDSTLEISCFRFNDGAITIENIMGGTAPYELFLSGPQLASGVGVSRFDSLGAGEYLLEVVDANGCVGSSEHLLLEPSPAQINVLDSLIELSLGEEWATTTFYSASMPTFRWLPVYGLSCSDCPEPIVSPPFETQYIIEMVDERGCRAFDTLLVKVDVSRDIWLPDAFTPSKNNRNDYFTIRSRNPAAIAQVDHFKVFDRWGGVLFEQYDILPNDDRFGWDGMVKGDFVSPGTYVYEVKVTYKFEEENPQFIQGDFLLIR